MNDHFGIIVSTTSLSTQSIISNPSTPTYLCDILQNNFYFTGFSDTYTGNNVEYNINGCDDQIIEFNSRSYLGGADYAAERYPFEYRPTSILVTFNINVPVGYVIDSILIANYYATGLNSSAIRNLNWTTNDAFQLINESNGSQTYSFHLGKAYQQNGGTWPMSDEARLTNVRVKMSATCNVANNSVSSVTLHRKRTFIDQFITPNPALTLQHTLSSVGNIKYIKPNLSGQVTTPNPAITSDTVEWLVTLTNQHQTVGIDNAWLAQKGLQNNIQVRKIIDLASNQVYLPNNGIFQLGTINSASNKTYKVQATFAQCNFDSTFLAYGFDCSAYPSSNTTLAQNCYDTLKVYAQPVQPAVQLSVINHPAANATYDLCQAVPYEIILSNPAVNSTATDIGFKIIIPVTGGINIDATSVQYSLNNAAFAPISINASLSGNEITVLLPATAVPHLSYQQNVRLRFNMLTEACAYVSGGSLRFIGIAQDLCNNNLNSTAQASNKVTLTGSPTSTNTIDVTATAGNIEITNSQLATISAPYKVTFTNAAGGATSTMLDAVITVPKPFELVWNNNAIIAGMSNTPVISSNATHNIYTFDINSNLNTGDTFGINHALLSAPAHLVTCLDEVEVSQYATVSFTAVCSTNNVTCNSSMIIGEEWINFSVKRPTYTVTQVRVADSANHRMIVDSMDLTNTNNVYGASQANLTFIWDQNGNGIVDNNEHVIKDNVILTLNATAPTQTVNFSFRPNLVPATQLVNYKPMLIQVDFDNTCKDTLMFVNQDVVLPIELIHFNATLINDYSLLTWATAKEVNNKQFDIEYSVDGLEWTTIGTINSKAYQGNSNQRLNYEFKHTNLSLGKNLYRLRQIDNNRQNKLSATVIVYYLASDISIYPNPFKDKIKVMGWSEIYHIQVTDAVGKHILTKENIEPQEAVDLSHLTSGVYYIHLLDKEHKAIERLKAVKL